MTGRKTVSKAEKRLTSVFSRKCKNLIGLSLLQLATSLLLFAIGITALVIYRYRIFAKLSEKGFLSYFACLNVHKF